MGTLIDSSVLVAVERELLPLDALLEKIADEECAIASISASELLHGVHRAKTTAQRNQREAFVEAMLARLPVIAFDLLTARLHARLSAQLAEKGAVVGAHDLLIASTALAKGYRVVTRDERSFPRIPGVLLLRL